MSDFLTLEMAFENIVGKGKSAGNQHFLLFQQSFVIRPEQLQSFYLDLLCRLQILFDMYNSLLWTGIMVYSLVRNIKIPTLLIL